jgi:beta-hydroxylase
MFACLPAGASLKRHRDPYAGSYRYHLGLQTPNSDDCYILVDGNRHAWYDGKDVLFDETFIHEAHNKTEHQRIIFFADVHRPMCSKWIDNLNHWVSDHIIKASSSSNDEGEEVGVLNKAFEKLYSIRTVSRKLKHWNKPIYSGLKYTLFFAVLYYIFF